MKKYFFILLLVFSNTVISQIKFGVKGGLNMTDASLGANIKVNIQTENVTVVIGENGSTGTSEITNQEINQSLFVATSPKVSFYIGGFLEYPINKKGNLALKAELLYCQNGTTIDKKTANEQEQEENIFYTSQGASYTIGQLNVPILLKFTTNKKIAFHAGGYFGAILLAKASSGGLTVDFKSRYKTIDLGLNIGASYPINKNFAVEVRYNRGLLNVDKFSETDGPFTAQGLYYNRTFHVGLEYFF